MRLRKSIFAIPTPPPPPPPPTHTHTLTHIIVCVPSLTTTNATSAQDRYHQHMITDNFNKCLA